MQYKGGHVEGLRRNVKDSLFTYYFSDPKHALEMYKALFPEDKNVTAADIQIVTLTNVLAAGMYNDLGFLVKDRMIILVEAQSSYSENITLRLLFYIAGTYREFVEKSRSDIYGMKKVWIPKPEFFVVYTGREKTPDQIPDELCLPDLFAAGSTGPKDDISLELRVKILTYTGTNNIKDQYIRFCQIADEQRVKYPDDKRKAAEETVRICIEEGVMAVFLGERRREVVDMMEFLFTDEEINRMREHSLREEGREEGSKARLVEMIGNMLKKGRTPEEISDFCGIPLDEVKKVEAELKVLK